MAYSVPWNLMGFQVQGDFADWTIYTNRRGKKVIFQKDEPRKPRSPAQLKTIARFINAQAQWSALSADQKRNLELATIRLSMCLTGQNLFMSAALRDLPDHYATVARQSRLLLPAWTPIP